MDNANSREYLDKILIQVLENMRRTIHAPSTQATEIPRESLAMDDEEEAALDDEDEDMNADRRNTQRRADKYVEKNGELSSDDEGDEPGEPSRLPGRDMRRARMNYRNLLDAGADSGVETGSGMDTSLRGSSLPDEDEMMGLDGDATGNATPSPALALTGSAAMSGQQSPLPAAVDDGDVDMGDADTAPAPAAPAPAANTGATIAEGQMTPPDSPPPAPAPAAAPTTNGAGPSSTAQPQTETQVIQEQMQEEDKAIKAEEDGRMERERDNAEGQARTDAVAKVEDSEQ